MIAKHLAFIQDGHFLIGNTGFCKGFSYYSTDQYLSDKDKDGVYTYLNGQKHYLVAVNGEEASKYINYALDERGEVFYQLGMLAEEIEGKISIDLEFDDDLTQQVLLEPPKSSFLPGLTYCIREIDNIPVIENRNLSPSPARVRFIEHFVAVQMISK